jgi:hypothetical protein
VMEARLNWERAVQDERGGRSKVESSSVSGRGGPSRRADSSRWVRSISGLRKSSPTASSTVSRGERTPPDEAYASGSCSVDFAPPPRANKERERPRRNRARTPPEDDEEDPFAACTLGPRDAAGPGSSVAPSVPRVERRVVATVSSRDKDVAGRKPSPKAKSTSAVAVAQSSTSQAPPGVSVPVVSVKPVDAGVTAIKPAAKKRISADEWKSTRGPAKATTGASARDAQPTVVPGGSDSPGTIQDLMDFAVTTKELLSGGDDSRSALTDLDQLPTTSLLATSKMSLADMQALIGKPATGAVNAGTLSSAAGGLVADSGAQKVKRPAAAVTGTSANSGPQEKRARDRSPGDGGRQKGNDSTEFVGKPSDSESDGGVRSVSASSSDVSVTRGESPNHAQIRSAVSVEFEAVVVDRFASAVVAASALLRRTPRPWVVEEIAPRLRATAPRCTPASLTRAADVAVHVWSDCGAAIELAGLRAGPVDGLAAVYACVTDIRAAE